MMPYRAAVALPSVPIAVMIFVSHFAIILVAASSVVKLFVTQ